MPGLGHVYIGRVARALIWFVGLLIILGILNQQSVDPAASWAMYGVVVVVAAADAVVLARTDDKSRRL
jgi:hypothetical protein